MTHPFFSQPFVFVMIEFIYELSDHQMWMQRSSNVRPLDSAGIGVPGLFHGLVPGQGLPPSLSHHLSFLSFVSSQFLCTNVTKHRTGFISVNYGYFRLWWTWCLTGGGYRFQSQS